MALTLSTDAFHPYSVQFSPFFPDRLACCANENYGISGSGSIYVHGLVNQSVRRLVWQKGIFDVAWSEDHPSQLLAGTADGRILLYNVDEERLVLSRREHDQEVCHIDYSSAKDTGPSILTSSWDKTLSLIDASRPDFPTVRRFPGHSELVYCGVFSPRRGSIFASTSRDGTFRVWDVRSPPGSPLVVAQQAELLACDWCKYDDSLLATGGTDHVVKIWDLRKLPTPAGTLVGHEYAVRRVKWSPFFRSHLLTCSYDKTVRVWNPVLEAQNGVFHCVHTISHHSEFVYGLDYSMHVPGQIADCSWDRTLKVYRVGSLMCAL